MLSNEMSLEAKIKASGETWTGGMTVRVVDIGVEDVNSMVDVSTMQAIERVSENYGWAGPAFVRGLAACRSGVDADTRSVCCALFR